MPPHHHHGGGFRGGFGPYGYGWGYPVEYPATELVVVNPSPQDSEFQRRAMAHIMTLPKGKRYAAYLQIFGKAAAPGSLGSTMNDSGRGADDRTLGAIAIPTRGDRTGIFSRPTLDLPRAGAPEILGDCGCGCAGSGACKGVGAIDLSTMSTPMKLAAVGAAYLLYRHLKKRR